MTTLPLSNRGPRALVWLSRLASPLLVMLLAGCDTNPFDPAQQPEVTVTDLSVAGIFIEWQPAGAQLVRVYRGSIAGDGYGESLMWSIAANTKNSLMSGVRYGASPTEGTTDVP